MASFGRISNSLVTGVNENTLALASLNFDFSLFKVEAPLEYSDIGNALTKHRRKNAEAGATHQTARKLGALFELAVPSVPKVISAYGERASEIIKTPGANPLGETAKHGPFANFVGVDATSIWAAATSGGTSIAIHLLACLLARAFPDPAESASIWAELVLERQYELLKYAEGPMVNVAHLAALNAAQQEISRAELRQWDTSARAWLRTADSVMQKKCIQFKLILKNLSINMGSGARPYPFFMRAWTQAMLGLERLLNSEPQSVTDGSILWAISSWHLFPNLLVLGNQTTNVSFEDALMPTAGVLTVGINTSTASNDYNSGINWSVALSHYRYYGTPVKAVGRIDDRLTIDELYFVSLGSLLDSWKVPPSMLDLSLQWFSALWKCVSRVKPSLQSHKPAWLENLAITADRYLASTEQARKEYSSLIAFGRRRGRNFLCNSRVRGGGLPWFGLRYRYVLDTLSHESAHECGVQYLRHVAKTAGLKHDEALITAIWADTSGLDSKGELHEYTTAVPRPVLRTVKTWADQDSLEELPGLDSETEHSSGPSFRNFKTEHSGGLRRRDFEAEQFNGPHFHNLDFEAQHFSGLHPHGLDFETEHFDGLDLDGLEFGTEPFSGLPMASRDSDLGSRSSGISKEKGKFNDSPKHVEELDLPVHSRPYATWTASFSIKNGSKQHGPRDLRMFSQDSKLPLNKKIDCTQRTRNDGVGFSDCVAHLPAMDWFPKSPVTFTQVLGDSENKLNLWITMSGSSRVRNLGWDNPALRTGQTGEPFVDLEEAIAALQHTATMPSVVEPIMLWQYFEGPDPYEPQDFIKPLLEIIHPTRDACSMVINSLRSLALAHKIYSQLDGATVSSSIVDRGLHDVKWGAAGQQNTPTKSMVFSCIAMMETGTVHLDAERLGEVIALSSGNSIFVSSQLLKDPSTAVADYAVTRLVGNIGRSGISLLIPPPAAPLVRPLSSSWRAVNYSPFDGKREDNFKGTTLHLSFTSNEFPLDYGVTGIVDHQVFLVESIVSVLDAGTWVADLNVLGPLEQLADRCLRVPRPLRCNHSREILSEALSKFAIVDTWEEVLDTPPTIGLVRAHGNWCARLAAAILLSQLSHDQESNSKTRAACEHEMSNFMPRVLVLDNRDDVCWVCVYRRLKKRAALDVDVPLYLIT